MSYIDIQAKYLDTNQARLHSGFWYLASPFAKVNKEEAQEEALKAVAYLLKNNIYAWSPIAHSAGLEKYLPPEKLTHDFMLHYDGSLLSPAVGIIFFLLNGWINSVGMKAEYDYCITVNKPYFSLPQEWITNEFGNK